MKKLALLLLLFPSSALGQSIHVIDTNHFSNLPKVERALLKEVNGPLRKVWHTPRITFGNTGWPVTIEQRITGDGGGLHYDFPVRASVWPGTTKKYPWTMMLAHEVIEMTVDPYLDRRIRQTIVEVCDPVQSIPVRFDNILLSDFVYPAFYLMQPGQQDYANGGH